MNVSKPANVDQGSIIGRCHDRDIKHWWICTYEQIAFIMVEYIVVHSHNGDWSSAFIASLGYDRGWLRIAATLLGLSQNSAGLEIWEAI